MTCWKDKLLENPIPWLLEPDKTQPAIRYFTLRDILGHSSDDNEVKEALTAIMLTGPVPVILVAQEQDGYWGKSSPGYGPKYRGTQWAIIFMGQLGADGNHPRVQAGCEYILTHTIASNESLSMNGTPSSFIHCMSGNLGAALIDLGWLEDQHLLAALEWQAQAITGGGVSDSTRRDTNKRYYKSGIRLLCSLVLSI
ncbi:hypothetical protein ACFLTP_07055 [Chloroflexota bacterium]